MKATLAVFLNAVLVASLAPAPVFARVEDYGARRYTQVGRRGAPGHEVVDRRGGGPGWGGVAAAGIIGAIAGLALGSGVAAPAAPVAVPVAAPPPIGGVVAYLPGACATVPTYNGAVLYNCGGIYYQPIYEGTSLMYQVVPAP